MKMVTDLGVGTKIEIEKISDGKYHLTLKDSQTRDQWKVRMTKEQAEEIGAGLMQLLTMGIAP